MNYNTKIRLWLMMFVQFFVWGSWYGQLSKYMTDGLHATGGQVGAAYAAFSIAMIVSPFFVGMLADRFFAAERVLAVLNLLGAAILYYMFGLTDPLAQIPPGAKEAVEIPLAWNKFYWTMLLYCLTFAPAIALTSSIALRHVSNPEKEFPVVRVFGTLSWIAVTNLVGYLGVGGQNTIFLISAGSALLMGVMSFTLPHTPPTATGPTSVAQIVGKDAFVLFKDRSFLIFFIASVLVCIPLSFYYTWGNPSLTDAYKEASPELLSSSFNIENKMSLGQVSEVLFMLLLTVAYRGLGVKKILIIGLVAWIIRFLFLGYGDANDGVWMLYIAILLHGVCFDFFFVTGYMYADEKAGEKIKSQAQGLIALATYGLGMFIGSIVAGEVKDLYKSRETPFVYQELVKSDTIRNAELDALAKSARLFVKTMPEHGSLNVDTAENKIAYVHDIKFLGTFDYSYVSCNKSGLDRCYTINQQVSVKEIPDWTQIWLVPAGIAAIVLLLFVLFFHDNTRQQKIS